ALPTLSTRPPAGPGVLVVVVGPLGGAGRIGGRRPEGGGGRSVVVVARGPPVPPGVVGPPPGADVPLGAVATGPVRAPSAPPAVPGAPAARVAAPVPRRPRAASTVLKSGARVTRCSSATRPHRAPWARKENTPRQRSPKAPRRLSAAMAAPTRVSPGGIPGSMRPWSKARSPSRSGRSWR